MYYKRDLTNESVISLHLRAFFCIEVGAFLQSATHSTILLQQKSHS